MIIRLHRWQPNPKRYRTQIFNMADDEAMGSPFVDLVLDTDMIQKQTDITTRQIMARTQRVTRILMDPTGQTVDIYMAPVKTRKYERKANAEKTNTADCPSCRKQTATVVMGDSATCMVCGDTFDPKTGLPSFIEEK